MSWCHTVQKKLYTARLSVYGDCAMKCSLIAIPHYSKPVYQGMGRKFVTKNSIRFSENF